MSGIRYRNGKRAVPPDRTLVKLSSVPGISPDALRAHARGRAAELLEASAEQEPAYFATEQEAQPSVAGRAALARQVLAAFSTAELQQEVKRRQKAKSSADERRNRAEDEAMDQQVRDDAAADLRADLGVL